MSLLLVRRDLVVPFQVVIASWCRRRGVGPAGSSPEGGVRFARGDLDAAEPCILRRRGACSQQRVEAGEDAETGSDDLELELLVLVVADFLHT